jgi:hypothetical protein
MIKTPSSSLLQFSPPKGFLNYSPSPCVPRAQPISSPKAPVRDNIWWEVQIMNYAVFFVLQLLHLFPVKTKLSTPRSCTPSAYVPSLTWQTKFHTHTRNNSTLTIKVTRPVIRHMCVYEFRPTRTQCCDPVIRYIKAAELHLTSH